VDELIFKEYLRNYTWTTETFIGPDGETGGFSGYVTNIWIKERCDWKLLSAEISSTTPP